MEIETSKLHLSFREPKEYSKPLLPITKEEKTPQNNRILTLMRKKNKKTISGTHSL